MAPSTQALLFPKADAGDRADYEVMVYTADARGAGTDGQVEIKVIGDLGCSEWIQLKGQDSCFSRAAVDTFNVTGVNVNDLSHVSVRLVNQTHSGWNLQKVEVLHKGTGWKSVFYCNDWLTAAAPSLTLVEADTWQAMSKYTVAVKTSDLQVGHYDTALLPSKPNRTQPTPITCRAPTLRGSPT